MPQRSELGAKENLAAKTQVPMFKYVNIDSETLEVTLSKTRGNGLALPKSAEMYELVRYKFMYPIFYAPARKKGFKVSYCLAEVPLWLTTIAGIMCVGVIQGATWETVKFSVRKALTKLSGVGLAPKEQKSTKTSIRAGWGKYSQPGRKQYEMFLSIRRTVKGLPQREALAYARAMDDVQFGRILRGEDYPALDKKTSARFRAKAKQ